MFIDGASSSGLDTSPNCDQMQMTMLDCIATVTYLRRERGEPDIPNYVKHWDLLCAIRTGHSTQGLHSIHSIHESELIKKNSLDLNS